MVECVRRQPKPGASCFMGIPQNEPSKRQRQLVWAALVMVVVGGVSWRFYPLFDEYLESRPDRGDFQGNPELLARMQSAVISAPADTVTAHDWPQWRGPRRDGIAGAFNLLAPWPAGGPRVLWRA